jgi:hypothetical protein
MAQHIKTIEGNIRVEFDKGVFDDWCVYLCKPGYVRYAPKDTDYFESLKKLGKVHGDAAIYNSFLTIYLPTNKYVNTAILDLITTESQAFGEDALEINIWFTVIYAGMVAEENKAHAILKKRIKRLGMHQLLLENKSPTEAANFSKGKKWRDLDLIMKQKGF